MFLCGYERYDLIEGKGQFSIRGGIVDIATSRKSGIRIEFWGDEIDSIRNFNISNGKSTENLEEVKIFPAMEFILNDSLENITERIVSRPYTVSSKEKVLKDVEQIKNGDYLTKIDKYFNDFYLESETLLDYLEDNTIIFLDEIEKIKSRAENISRDNEHLTKDLIEKNRVVPQILTNMDDYYNFCEKQKR